MGKPGRGLLASKAVRTSLQRAEAQPLGSGWVLIEAVILWESIAGVLMEIRTFPDGNPLLVEPVARTDPWPCSEMPFGSDVFPEE